jgi:hypothetical protein
MSGHYTDNRKWCEVLIPTFHWKNIRLLATPEPSSSVQIDPLQRAIDKFNAQGDNEFDFLFTKPKRESL